MDMDGDGDADLVWSGSNVKINGLGDRIRNDPDFVVPVWMENAGDGQTFLRLRSGALHKSIFTTGYAELAFRIPARFRIN